MRGLGGTLSLLGAAVGLGCGTTEPSHFVVQYEVRPFGCSTGPDGCNLPGDTISTADRGDTVWVFSGVQNPVEGDSTLVRLRPDCAVNIEIVSFAGNTVERTLPAAITCPDSTFVTYVRNFMDTRPDVDFRYLRWVVDSGLAPGNYLLRGKVLVEPRLEPAFFLPIN